MKVAIIVIFILHSNNCAKLPSSFKKCNPNDSNFQNCLNEAFLIDLKQLDKPFPEIGLPNLNPLQVPKLDLHSNGYIVQLKENLRNCQFHNLQDMKLDLFKIDLEKHIFQIKGVFKHIVSFCDYHLHGQIFYIPIYGDGKSSLSFVTGHFQEIIKENETYIKPISMEIKGQPSNLELEIDNLYGGYKTLSSIVSYALSKLWFVLYNDISTEYLHSAGDLLLDIFNPFFDKVPINELFDFE